MKPTNGAVVLFFHAAYWLIYLLLIAAIFAVAESQVKKSALVFSKILPLIVLSVAPNLISFYVFYFLLFAKFLSRRKIFALIVSGAFVCLVSALSGAFLSLAFFGFEQAIFNDAREFLFLTTSLFAVAAIHGSIALVIRGFLVWFDEIKLKEELARRNFETEIALVKSQINPHFLFNTINNIDILITRDAARASAYLNKLSDILRYAVYETKSEKIPLERELEYIEKYLELQKIRTANPNYIKFQITGEPNGSTVAPMIFFPFIENAFKHTENKKKASSIKIEFTIEKDKIVFECENSHQFDENQKQDFGGAGNDLIKKRLELIYGGKHDLQISDGNGIYRVKLTLI